MRGKGPSRYYIISFPCTSWYAICRAMAPELATLANHGEPTNDAADSKRPTQPTASCPVENAGTDRTSNATEAEKWFSFSKPYAWTVDHSMRKLAVTALATAAGLAST